MNVVFLSPAYPIEMAEYTRGLAEVGAHVFGVGDSPVGALPAPVRNALTDYLQVPRILDEADVVARVRTWLRGRTVDRVEACWEPVVILAARIREALGVPGMSVHTAIGFRDKAVMKERIAAAGLRVPMSARVRTKSEAYAAAERIGFPLVFKPIAGAGTADTHRADNPRDFEKVLEWTRRVPEASIEEYIDGEEYTFDALSIDGKPVYENVGHYVPRPLIARNVESCSPVTLTVRDMYAPHLSDGIELGRKVLGALGMGTGFTHMEWFRKPDGEVVFGEIGGRPPGARLVDEMNMTSDIDLFREWARVVCWRSFEAVAPRKYNVALVFKRAIGEGRITRIEGLKEFCERHQEAVVAWHMLEIGERRRDWRATLLSDGYIFLRNPDWHTTLALAAEAGDSIRLYAAP